MLSGIIIRDQTFYLFLLSAAGGSSEPATTGRTQVGEDTQNAAQDPLTENSLLFLLVARQTRREWSVTSSSLRIPFDYVILSLSPCTFTTVLKPFGTATKARRIMPMEEI